jgi:MFS family permease
MLAAWATPTTRGKIYGFHRAMDHAGAVIGPALASLFLFFYPGSYRTLFALTIIPGAIAVLLIFFVREPDGGSEVGFGSRVGSGPPVGSGPHVGSGFSRIATDDAVSDPQVGSGSRVSEKITGTQRPQRPQSNFVGNFLRPLRVPRSNVAFVQKLFSRIAGESVASGERPTVAPRVASNVSPNIAEPLPRKLKAFFAVLSLFMLGNSTDAFLLLKLTEVAGSTKFIPLMWAGLHLVKASVSIVGGSWSDRIGRRAVIVMGWLVYAAVYVGFAIADSLVPLLACFFGYGLYFGFAEGTERALVADLAPESRRGFAFGVYNAVLGFGALTASILFGVLWSSFGPDVAFGAGAALALLASALLFIVV